jgi:hypothetical protein
VFVFCMTIEPGNAGLQDVGRCNSARWHAPPSSVEQEGRLGLRASHGREGFASTLQLDLSSRYFDELPSALATACDSRWMENGFGRNSTPGLLTTLDARVGSA